MFMDGVCEQRDVLGVVHFCPAAVSGFDRLADHGRRAILYGDEAEAEDERKVKRAFTTESTKATEVLKR